MDVIPAVLLLAVLVVVPVAVPLLPALRPRHATIAVGAAVPAAVAVLLDPGALAAALTLPWLAAAGVGALVLLRWWWDGPRSGRTLTWPVAGAYLVVGAAWLLADRLDVRPVGVLPPFVVLTAVHFHYAGFAAATLAACLLRRRPDDRVAQVAALATVGTPPLVALGFTSLPVLQVLGAILLTVGLWLVAWTTVRHVAPSSPGPSRLLLWVSSLSVLAPMVLAVQWAVGHNLGTPALSIPDMARTHGVVNAVGFALAGLLGWRLGPGRAPVVSPPRPAAGPRP